MTGSSFFLVAICLLALTVVTEASPTVVQKRDGMQRGYAAAAPDAWAANILKGKVSSYYHWENPPIKAAGNHEFIPQFWGNKKMSQWNAQKATFDGKAPQHILGQNELDVAGQADENAEQAAQGWCDQLRPFQERGSQVGSATAYNVKILTSMSKKIKEKCGGQFDFIAAHWYGGFDEIEGFKKAMTAQHDAFPDKKLWITEFATTAKGGGNQQQTKAFMQEALKWCEDSGFVDRVFYFGGWSQNPDGYANNANKFFKGDGSLTDIAYAYQYD